MAPNVRAAIAYTAGRLLTGSQQPSVYDYSTSQHRNMSGDVGSNNVNVYDYESSCHMTGDGSGGKFSLYHYGVNNHISLEVKAPGHFEGYDYASGRHFNGTVNGNNVSFYDYEDGQYYNYSL